MNKLYHSGKYTLWQIVEYKCNIFIITFQLNTLLTTQQCSRIAAATISQRQWHHHSEETTGSHRQQLLLYGPRSRWKSTTIWKRCPSNVGSIHTGTTIPDANGRWWRGYVEVPTSCSSSVTVSYHFWNCVF